MAIRELKQVHRLPPRHGYSAKCRTCTSEQKVGGLDVAKINDAVKDYTWAHAGHNYHLEKSFHAAELAHATATKTTRVTTTSSTYSDVDATNGNAAITSGSFTSGKKYLLIVTARIDSGGTNSSGRCRMVHGSTAFDGSEYARDPDTNSGTANEFNYFWWTIWTAVSSEGIKLQFRSQTTETTGVDNVFITAIKLSDDLTEDTGSGGDWKYNEVTTDGAITTGLDGGSITFTPASSSNWLVMSLSQYQVGGTANEWGSKIVSTGDVSSSAPSAQMEGEDTANDWTIISMFRVFALTNQSNTFKEQTYHNTTGSSGTRLHSQIFALNLNKLRNHSNGWNEAEFDATATTNYVDEILEISITPDVQGDVLVMGFFAHDTGGSNISMKGRVQVDGSDIISGWSTDAYAEMNAWDPADECDWAQHAIVNMTAAAHTIEMDASTSNAASFFEDRSLVAVTMELPSGGQALVKIVNETEQSSEALNYIRGRIQHANETEQSSEATNYTRLRIQNIGETEQASEAENHALTLRRVTNESEQAAEVVNEAENIVRSLSDTIEVSEAKNKIIGLIKMVAETVQSAESVNAAVGIVKNIAEAENIAEVAQKVLGFVKWVNESEQVSEALNHVIGALLVKNVAETIQLVDTINKVLGLVRTVDSEEISVFEFSNYIKNIVQVVGEVMNLNEAFNKLVINPAQIDHYNTVVTTRQTVTGNVYTAVPGASIPSSFFVPGEKYLILVSALLDSSSASGSAYVKAVHGTSDFAHSEYIQEPAGAMGVSNEFNYFWFDVWTAVDGEAITLQYKNEAAGSTTGIDQVSMTAIRITSQLTENTDWFFSSVTADTPMPAAGTTSNNASVTLAQTGDWLVLTLSRFTPGNSTDRFGSRMLRSGEASSSSPSFQWEGEAPAPSIDRMVITNMRVFVCGAGSNTFSEQAFHDGTGDSGTRHRSQVFAINLNKFRDHQFVFDEAEITPTTTTDFANEASSITITPTTDQGDILVIGSVAHDVNIMNATIKSRIQIDDVLDLIAGMTLKAYPQMNSWDASDEVPSQAQGIFEDVASGTHTISMDVSTSNLATRFEDRFLLAVTMQRLIQGQALIKFANESIELIENALRALGLIKTVNESEELNDNINRVVGFIRAIHETVNSTEAMNFIRGLSKVASESVSVYESGSSLQFNSASSQYVSIGDIADLSFADNIFAISVFAKFDDNDTTLHGILGKRGSPWEYSVHVNTAGSITFHAWNSTGSTVYTTTVTYDTLPHHWLWSADGTNARLYRDGVLLTTVAKTANNMSDTTAPFRIGEGGSGAGARYMKGRLAKVEIYSDNLSAEDARKLAAGQSIATAPVGRWKFDEGAGLVAKDSISSNNGTLTNGPTWSTDAFEALSGIIRLLGLSRSVGESEQVIDTINRTLGISKTLNFSIEIADVESQVRGLARSISEVVNADEEILHLIGIVKLINESETVVEAQNRVLALVRLVMESEQIGENIVKLETLIRTINENQQVVEAINKVSSLVRVINELQEILENHPQAMGFTKVVNEAVEANESIIKVQQIIKVITEALNINEAALKTLGLVQNVAEGVSIAEATNRVEALCRVVTESEQAVESVNRLGLLIRQIGESQTVEEAENHVRALVRLIAEDTSIPETLNRLSGLIRHANEVQQVTEELNRILGITRTVTETEQVGEALQKVLGLVRVLNEASQVAESIAKFKGIVKVILESTSLAEAINKLVAAGVFAGIFTYEQETPVFPSIAEEQGDPVFAAHADDSITFPDKSD